MLAQACIFVEARPQDLITGIHGMADILRRAWPPDFAKLPDMLWPAVETVDIGVFGTAFGLVFALPLAVLAARNTTPARPIYFMARAVVAFTNLGESHNVTLLLDYRGDRWLVADIREGNDSLLAGGRR